MARFYFDTSDGEEIITDDEGVDFANFAQAREAAVAGLPDIAREVLPDGSYRVISVTIRDEAGQRLARASLTLKVEMLV
jgi:hypothetical protein